MVFLQGLEGIQDYKISHFRSLIEKKIIQLKQNLLDIRQQLLAMLSVISVTTLSSSANLIARLASRQYQTHYQNAGIQK